MGRYALTYEDEIRIIRVLNVCTFYARGFLLKHVMEVNTLCMSLTPCTLGHMFNPLTPNDPYRGRTAQPAS